MATEFKLPELGENIESGDLVRLMIKPGGTIAEGQPVMELETDKAVIEVPSSVTGTVGEIRVKEGDKLRVGQVIFTVENGARTAPVREAGANRQRLPAVPAASIFERSCEPRPESRSHRLPHLRPRPRPTAAPALPPAEFKLPELGENIDSGDLVRLMISPGATRRRRPTGYGTRNR